MANATLSCTRCRSVLELPGELPYQRTLCPLCSTELECWLFPALVRRPASGSPGQSTTGGESACFNHPGRLAVVECGGCGRFLCALCDLEVRGRHWCPACFEKKRIEGSLSLLPDRLIRYDRLALALTLLPMLFCCGPSLITVPIMGFVVVKHWNAPGSERASVRSTMLVSMILGVVQVLVFLYWMYVAFARGT